MMNEAGQRQMARKEKQKMASERVGTGPTARVYTESEAADGVVAAPLPSGYSSADLADSRAPENRSLGELFSELSADMSELLQKEVALAQAEMMGKVSKVAKGAGMAVGGGMLAYGGLILLLIAFSFFLAQWMAFWIASGIVAIVTLVIGLILLQVGRSRIEQTKLTPEKTIESLKADAEWAKEQVQ
jgi:hypothetical protein